jgi:hypothetical protein
VRRGVIDQAEIGQLLHGVEDRAGVAGGDLVSTVAEGRIVLEVDRMSKKRRFGRVRRLPSGRWQARYPGPDDIDRAADGTFETKTDAEVWLTVKEAEILNGDWINPDDGKVLLAEYGRTWITERPGLRPKTIELYSYLLRKHVAPRLGPHSHRRDTTRPGTALA